MTGSPSVDLTKQLARVAYGGADFILMPSRFEPCGLPQMIAPLYGCLPVAHNTGGIHDTVAHLAPETDSGNGFLFDVYDSQGLFWAIDQAMLFHGLPVRNAPETDQTHHAGERGNVQP